MPLYDFKDPDGNVVEKFFTVDDMEQFVKDNPDWKKLVATNVGFARENTFGKMRSKHPGWAEKLDRMGKANGVDLTPKG